MIPYLVGLVLLSVVSVLFFNRFAASPIFSHSKTPTSLHPEGLDAVTRLVLWFREGLGDK